MATREQDQRVQNRGLLTEDDRQFWRGEKDVDDPDKTAREKRHNVRQRIENIVEDLQILNTAAEDDLVDKFHGETDRNAKVTNRMEELEQELDQVQELKDELEQIKQFREDADSIEDLDGDPE